MSSKSNLQHEVGNLLALAAAMFILPAGSALAQEWTLDRDQRVEQPPPYSPFVDQHFPQQVFFGDTHHHSSYFVDSGMFGNAGTPIIPKQESMLQYEYAHLALKLGLKLRYR